jgi:hypothetical protein
MEVKETFLIVELCVIKMGWNRRMNPWVIDLLNRSQEMQKATADALFTGRRHI